MKGGWAKFLAWFAARQSREKLILALAFMVGPILLGFNLLIEPALVRGSKAARLVADTQMQLTAMRQAEAELARNAQDPDAPIRLQLEQLRATRAEQAQRFQEIERSVISPQAMPDLLRELLGHAPSIELLAMKSLPPESLLRDLDPKPGAAGAAPAADAATATATSAANLYRHGLELRLAGTYADLLNYLARLEERAPNLGWGPIELRVAQHPRCELNLTVYSISLDSAWLVI